MELLNFYPKIDDVTEHQPTDVLQKRELQGGKKFDHCKN